MNKYASLIIMVLILFVAGVVHLASPSIFIKAMPDYIPYHTTLIYITGVIELILGIGLLLKRFRKLSAFALMTYFVAILPAHFHMALNDIPMFGYDSPYVLWGRTAFQLVFIYWAYKLKDV